MLDKLLKNRITVTVQNGVGGTEESHNVSRNMAAIKFRNLYYPDCAMLVKQGEVYISITNTIDPISKYQNDKILIVPVTVGGYG